MSKTYDALANYTNGFKEGYDMGFKAGFEEASKLQPKGKLAEEGFSALCPVCGIDFAKDTRFGWNCYNQNCPSNSVNVTKSPTISPKFDSMIG